MTTRATWKGVLSFGLVNIPVAVHTAVRDEDERLKFNMLHECEPARGKGKGAKPAVLSPITMKRVCKNETCPSKGAEIEFSDLKKGHEFASGRFVVVEKEEFDAASIEGSKVLAIEEFVPGGEVPLRYLEKPYFLAPQKGAEGGYALVREALRKTGMLGVCNATLRENGSHLACVGVDGDALVLYMLRYASCVTDPATFALPGRDVPGPQLKMAQQLVEQMTDRFSPEKYRDEYGENVRKIVEAKIKGAPVEVRKAVEAPTTSAVDLMAKLSESLAAPKAKARKLRKTA